MSEPRHFILYDPRTSFAFAPFTYNRISGGEESSIPLS